MLGGNLDCKRCYGIGQKLVDLDQCKKLQIIRHRILTQDKYLLFRVLEFCPQIN